MKVMYAGQKRELANIETTKLLSLGQTQHGSVLR